RTVDHVRLTKVATLGGPADDWTQDVRGYLRRGPQRRDWERRAHAAARSWAEGSGYPTLTGESDTSLSFRNDAGEPLLVDLVAESELVKVLRATARRLGLESGLFGDLRVRTAIVLARPLDAAIASRLSRVLDPPIELYVLRDDDLHRL